MNRTWMLTALGKDQPGIVAGVTTILYERGCNLEDSAMSRLAGEFAIMLVFCAPGRLSQAKLERAFRGLSHQLNLVTHLKALTGAERVSPRAGRPYLLSVYGADRPGIVSRVSTLLARLNVNITDVSTHRTRATAAKPLYLMVLDIELPSRLSANRLEQRLRALAKLLGVRVSLRSAEAHLL